MTKVFMVRHKWPGGTKASHPQTTLCVVSHLTVQIIEIMPPQYVLTRRLP